MNTNDFETLRLIMAKWKLVALSGFLFAGLALIVGLRSQEQVKSTITFELAPGNYSSMIGQVTGGKSSDPLLDPLNQFSMLLFLLQDQVSAAEYLSQGSHPASFNQVRVFLSRFAVAADKKISGRATIAISGESGDDRESIVKAWLAFNQLTVMTKVKDVLDGTLDEYTASIETQIAGVRKAGMSARHQKIAEFETSLGELSPGNPSAGVVLEPVSGAAAFDPSGGPGGGVEVSAAVTPQGLRNQITLLKNLTPNAAELDSLDARRQIASLFRTNVFEVPVFRMMGTSTQPGRFSFALPIWIAFGAVLGSALALGGLILISQSKRLVREMKLAERRSAEPIRRAFSDEDRKPRSIRMEAAE
jgi:hypothetical protein